MFCLAFGEFVDDEVGVLFELLIACGGKHESAGGEVVAEGVAFDSFGFPAAIAGGFGLDASVDIESVEEADGVERLEILQVDFLPFELKTGEDGYPIEREGFDCYGFGCEGFGWDGFGWEGFGWDCAWLGSGDGARNC